MNKEIRCPHCNTRLEGRDKFYRSVVIDDTDWFGIENGKLVNCNTSLSQPSFGAFICITCGECIEDFIDNLIEEEILEEGDLIC